jgi:hypothetical protein
MIIGVTHDHDGRVVQRLSVSTKVSVGLPPNGDRNHPTKLDLFAFLRKKKSANRVEWEANPELTRHYGEQCRELHRTADVAVGVAAPMTRNQDGKPLINPVLTLTFVAPDLDARVVTFAYPRHANQFLDNAQIINLMPTWYDGDVKEYYPTGRDRVLLPAPCYRTSIIIHSGASGGPVFSRSGYVFGVNSTGIDGTDISFVSRINEIFNLTIEDVVMGSAPPRTVPISEIIRAGHISVIPPLFGSVVPR